MELPTPFNTFKIEKHAGEYKDFELAPEDTYPLKGVTYPVDYGDIEGYTGEDGDKLDLFVGNGLLCGGFHVHRPELPNGEHKFYINLTEEEEGRVLAEFEPVILSSQRYETVDGLREAIQPFRNTDQS